MARRQLGCDLAGAVIGATGVLGTNYFGRQVEREKEAAKANPPTPPALTDWRGLFLRGEVVALQLENELPENLSGALLIAGQRYLVRFSAENKEWISVGPIRHPSEGLVEKHTNRAGPNIKPAFGKNESWTAVAPDYFSPSEYKLVVVACPLTFDANGVVYFDRRRVGRLLKNE